MLPCPISSSSDVHGSENFFSSIDYVKGTVRDAMCTAIYIVCSALISAQVDGSGMGGYERISACCG